MSKAKIFLNITTTLKIAQQKTKIEPKIRFNYKNELIKKNMEYKKCSFILANAKNMFWGAYQPKKNT